LKIVLVEDGVEVELFALYQRLERRGIQIHPVKNPLIADTMVSIQEVTPDLICIGTKNSIAKGLPICKKIKSVPELAHLPVFIVPFVDISIGDKEVEESRVARFFTWPVDPDAVAEAICQYLRPDEKVPESEDGGKNQDNPSSDPLLGALAGIEGVEGIIKVTVDGATLFSLNLDEGKAGCCRAGVAYCGNAADSIGKTWNLGKFLHGAIIGEHSKVLLHQVGEDFLGTSILKDASARFIGPEIERILSGGNK
jgi:predicted regulator of Ras-like GTPase activity (Roadblock/LC7/MglB family)